MASTRSAVASTSKAHWDLLARGLGDIRNLVTCKICTRLMYEPYTTKCGHAFCYGCLSKWLNHGEQRRQCPDCRARVVEEPCPDYTIRNIVHVLLSNSSFLEDGDTTEGLQEEQKEETDILESDRTNPNGLFQGLFKHRYQIPVRDPADGVLRCPSCNWEVEESYCDRCELDLGGDDSLAGFSDAFYDSDFDDQSIDDLSDQPNEEDVAFIDDRTFPVPRYRAPPFDVGISDLYDGPGTYTDPYNLDSDSDDFRIHNPQRFHDARTGNERAMSGTSSLEVSDSEAVGSDESSDTDESEDESDSDSEGTTASDSSEEESDEEPVRQHRSNRLGQRTATHPPVVLRRPTGRPNLADVVDLRVRGGRPTERRRRQNQASASSSTATASESATSTVMDTNREEDKETSEESESEAPIAIRPRKRVRIVLDDSDEEDGVTAQRDTRARRRRMARRSSIVDDAANLQRTPYLTSWNAEPSTFVSALPPGRNRRSISSDLHLPLH